MTSEVLPLKEEDKHLTVELWNVLAIRAQATPQTQIAGGIRHNRENK